MIEHEEQRQAIIAKISNIYDLAPEHFSVEWHPDHPGEPVSIYGENVMALAYGKHSIPMEPDDWGIIALPVKGE